MDKFNEKEHILLLIADDEMAIRDGIRRMLDWEGLGIELLEPVSDGMEALETIQSLRPDIVLTDIRMPQLDGIELISEVRKRGIETEFIILSGYGDFKYAQAAIKYGVTSYLLKPIACQELQTEIEGLTEKILSDWDRIKKENHQHRQMRIGTVAIKEQFLHHLLQNHYTSNEIIQNTISNNGFIIEDQESVVMLISFHISQKDNPGDFTEEDVQLLRFSIRNIVEEMLEGKNFLCGDCEENYVALILNIKERENISQLAQDFVDKIEDFSHITIQISIGNRIANLMGTGKSFSSAMEAMSYRLYRNDTKIFDSQIFQYSTGKAMITQEIDTKELVDAILRNDKNQLFVFLTQFFNNLFVDANPTPSFLRGMCIYLVMDVQRQLTSYNEEGNDDFKEDPYVEINSRTEWTDIKQYIENLFEAYAEYLAQDGFLKRDSVIERVKEYVKEHLKERIQANEVAEHVNLSEVYLGIYFKKKTNTNFKKYVLNQKMEYAKEMLKWPDTTIPEVAIGVGYEEVSSFHRVFKKTTGMTPSEFQQQYR